MQQANDLFISGNELYASYQNDTVKLGVYSSPEKVIKIMDAIQSYYESETRMFVEYQETKFCNFNRVYKMPLDNELEENK